MQPTPEPWERFADLLLQREAALCRIVSGVPPVDFAGLYVAQEQVDALLRTLPGLDGPQPEQAEPVRAAFAPLVGAARDRLATWRRAATTPFAALARNARLGDDECEVLALLAAVELHAARQRLVAYVQDSVQLPRLALSTLPRLLGPEHVADRALAPGGALCRTEIAVVDAGAPWAVRMVGLAPRATWALRHDDSADAGLPAGARVLTPLLRVGVAPELEAAAPPQPVVVVHGADPDSRLLEARHRAGPRGCLVTAVPQSPAEWAAVVREASIGGLAVVLDLEAVPDAVAAAQAERADHLTWIWCSPRELPLDRLPRRAWIEVHVDDGSATEADWDDAFGIPVPAGLRLTREQLRHVHAATGGQVGRIADGVRRLAGGHLDTVAVRLRPQRGWEDLVLPADQTRRLHEIVARHRGRSTVYGAWGFPVVPSTGVVALLAGPSGTGKTLAAEVLAADLGLDLYRVELSSVVSKWLGETEKNLSRIFDAAQARELVLFFDEADALFGKRSDVSDAHDRYANVEVAYLLQRLETYDGLVVLATNLQRNIDPAFQRRISVTVDFTPPDEAQRLAIWQRAIPPKAPTQDLDLPWLARQFPVTGGVIHNAALAAAFLAAEDDAPITMVRIARALDREYQKLGRLRTEAEFADYHWAVSGPDSA